jgi:hypothetical protein
VSAAAASSASSLSSEFRATAAMAGTATGSFGYLLTLHTRFVQVSSLACAPASRSGRSLTSWTKAPAVSSSSLPLNFFQLPAQRFCRKHASPATRNQTLISQRASRAGCSMRSSARRRGWDASTRASTAPG